MIGSWRSRRELETGFEPATGRLQGGCSTGLSYSSVTLSLTSGAVRASYRLPFRPHAAPGNLEHRNRACGGDVERAETPARGDADERVAMRADAR